jgi:phage terminase small subunit
MELKAGDRVAWRWFSGVAEGEVLSVHTDKTQILSAGKVITRNGSKANPAVVIIHKNGNQVIKLASELLPV